MKRFKLNVGAAAAILGVVLAVTGSAFKSDQEPTHGKINGTWVSLDGLQEVSPSTTPSSGQYRCLNEPTEVCKAYFAPEDVNLENPMDEVSGIFDYVP